VGTGWGTPSNTAFTATTTPLTHPYVVNPGSGDDGSLAAQGDSNGQWGFRGFASPTPPASSMYYFSALVREASNAPSQSLVASWVGVGTGGDNGFSVGFFNGSLNLFYDVGFSTLYTGIVTNPTPNATYLVEVAFNVNSHSLAATAYGPSGAIAGTGGAFLGPNPGGGPNPQPFDVQVNDLRGFQLLAVGTNSTGINFDELRFGTERADVIQVPEPTSFALIPAGALVLGCRRRQGRR
jgi:hypothetical protein